MMTLVNQKLSLVLQSGDVGGKGGLEGGEGVERDGGEWRAVGRIGREQSWDYV